MEVFHGDETPRDRKPAEQSQGIHSRDGRARNDRVGLCSYPLVYNIRRPTLRGVEVKAMGRSVFTYYNCITTDDYGSWVGGDDVSLDIELIGQPLVVRAQEY